MMFGLHIKYISSLYACIPYCMCFLCSCVENIIQNNMQPFVLLIPDHNKVDLAGSKYRKNIEISKCFWLFRFCMNQTCVRIFVISFLRQALCDQLIIERLTDLFCAQNLKPLLWSRWTQQEQRFMQSLRFL